MAAQRARTGARPPEDVPYEGVPDHLHAPLAEWIADQAEYRSTLQALGMRLRLNLDWSGTGMAPPWTPQRLIFADSAAQSALN